MQDKRKVNKYSLSGKFIKTYENAKQAYYLTDVSKTRIIDVCEGIRYTAGKFIWKYNDDGDTSDIKIVKLKKKRKMIRRNKQ